MEVFLNITLPRMVYLSALDLCSPVKYRADIWLASSLKGALHLLEAFSDGEDAVARGNPIFRLMEHSPEEGHMIYFKDCRDQLQQEADRGVYSMFLVNDSTHLQLKISSARVGCQ